MIEDIKLDTKQKMQKSLDALANNFNKIRTGRAHPSILDGIKVDYYGVETPLSQAANISVLDARTLSISSWEKQMTVIIEKAILKSNLGLNPSTTGDLIRLPMPMLTEETRKKYTKQARIEAESAKISIRNTRRDALNILKVLLRQKKIGEDEERHGRDDVQKITDTYVANVDVALCDKETDLLKI